MKMSRDISESFKRLRKRSLVGEVRDELERMILEGELQAGERLNEINLADRLGVSRGPVREAARSLEREGLITAVTNQGVYVRKLSMEDALELYDLRAMIAGYLCGRVAKRCGAQEKAKLRGYVSRMGDAARAGDEEKYFELNLAFHEELAAISGAERAAELYNSLGKEVQLMRLRVMSGATALDLSKAEHDSIVAAFECGDVDVARRTPGNTTSMGGNDC